MATPSDQGMAPNRRLMLVAPTALGLAALAVAAASRRINSFCPGAAS